MEERVHVLNYKNQVNRVWGNWMRGIETAEERVDCGHSSLIDTEHFDCQPVLTSLFALSIYVYSFNLYAVLVTFLIAYTSTAATLHSCSFFISILRVISFFFCKFYSIGFKSVILRFLSVVIVME